jgi:hypothetical protein
MANRELFNSSSKILGEYLQQPANVASITSTQATPVTSIPITFPVAGYYALQGYVAKSGAGAVDATSTTRIYTPASDGWGEVSFTPAMVPPFATEAGVPACMTTTFYVSATNLVSTLNIAPGTALNVGATGAIEGQIWFLGSQ